MIFHNNSVGIIGWETAAYRFALLIGQDTQVCPYDGYNSVEMVWHDNVFV